MSVKVSGDEVDEDDETFTLTLSGAAGGASIGTAAATGTIADDDERGLVFAPGSVTVTEAAGAGRTAAYTVALASRPTAAVSVALASGDATAATASPATLSFTAANWKDGPDGDGDRGGRRPGQRRRTAPRRRSATRPAGAATGR